MLSASVSEIHLCYRCPRLMLYQRSGSKNAWKVGLPGSDEMPGSFFHDRIAAPFFKVVASGRNDRIVQKLAHGLETTSACDREKYLLMFLEKYFFIPVITKHAKRFQSVQIMSLGRGLELWNRTLFSFFDRFDPGQDPGGWKALLKKLLHDPEIPMSVTCKLDENTIFRVSGRYDALMWNPDKGEAILIEFKGRKSGIPAEDFLQVALYAWIFRQKTGISPRASVIYLEEDNPEVQYDAQILARIEAYLPGLFRRVAAIIRAMAQNTKASLPVPPCPDICRQCPFDRTCDADWGVRNWYEPAVPGNFSKVSVNEKKADQEDSQYDWQELTQDDDAEKTRNELQRLCNAFESLKLPVEPMGYILGPRFIRYKVKPIIEKGSTAKKLKNQAENIQVELGLSAAPMIQPQPGFVSVDVPRENSVPLTLGEVWRLGEKNRPDSCAAFPMGMAIDGSIFWADLTDPNMTGILVGGSSGSGKSVFLRAAVIGLALNASPDKIRMTLIDPKRVSFTDLEGLPHLSDRVVMDDESAIETLDRLIDEMEQRYRRFEENRVQNITLYNQVSKPMNHHVVIIDEYGDLMVHKETRTDLEKLVQRLGQKGRAAGMHIVLATQRPDAKVVTPVIKANLALKVALKVTTASNSSIILDQTGAEYLIGMGDMLIGGSIYPERLQGPLVTATEIEMAMKN